MNESYTLKKSHAYIIVSAFIIITGLLVLSYLQDTPTGSIIEYRDTVSSPLSASQEIAEPVSADEIYKMFLCSCCGRTIDAKCCGMAREMVGFVDSQVEEGLSKTDVIISTVKKYGLNTLVESMQDEVMDELLSRAPDERPIISVEPGMHDFGDVSQALGTVSTFFTVRNEGESALIIDGLQSSCGCTTASLEGSPFFGMPGHGAQGASPPGWSHEIPPGGMAELEVRYDPNMHRDFRGAATRTVYISSNDPIDFRKGVRIELNQVD